MLDTELLERVNESSPWVAKLLREEGLRQSDTVELIASENFCSDAVRAAMASVFTNKYCEGYPDMNRTGRRGRYYGGCAVADKLEQYCCDRWQKVFDTNYHVNVQPHSGSQANYAALAAVLPYNGKVLSMSLDCGGHLTHGAAVNFSGKLYTVRHYGVNKRGLIDYGEVERIARSFRPDVIIAGASAYPREINFGAFRRIANSVGALLLVDMAHIAGLVAAQCHMSPFGLADVITTTTHKTLRGPRGGMIFCVPELAAKVDSAVFPGSQGGPLMHIIAAKAVCAEEAATPQFKAYIEQVVKNAKAMATSFSTLGYNVSTGGTDNHMLLLDFTETHPGLSGMQVQELLDEHGITLNKNCVPGDKRPASQTSGVRIGTAPMTTKGWLEKDFCDCAMRIDALIRRAVS